MKALLEGLNDKQRVQLYQLSLFLRLLSGLRCQGAWQAVCVCERECVWEGEQTCDFVYKLWVVKIPLPPNGGRQNAGNAAESVFIGCCGGWHNLGISTGGSEGTSYPKLELHWPTQIDMVLMIRHTLLYQIRIKMKTTQSSELDDSPSKSV